MKIPARMESAALGFLMIVFAALALSRFGSPALLYDSLLDQARGAVWAEGLRNGILPSSLLPPRTTYRHGNLTSYAVLPFYFLFGTDWRLMRLMPVGSALAALWLTFALTKRVAGSGTALLAAALLAIHPSFVLGTKVGAMHASYMIVLSTGALCLLHRWWTTKSRWALFGGAFLPALGLGTQAWFAWFAAGLAATALICGARRRKILGAGDLAAAGLGVFAGALPLLLLELDPARSSIMEVFLESSQPRPLGERLGFAAAMANTFMAGGAFWTYFGFPEPSRLNVFFPALFWTSLAAGSAVVLMRGSGLVGGYFRFAATLFAMMLVPVVLGPELSDFHYFHVFLPLPQILIALAVRLIAGAPGRIKRPGTVALGALLAVAALGEARVLRAFDARLAATGAVRRGSDALYDLADWLGPAVEEQTPIVCVDPWLRHNLLMLLPHARFADVSLHNRFFLRNALLTKEELRRRWDRHAAAADLSKTVIVRDMYHMDVGEAGLLTMFESGDHGPGFRLERRKDFRDGGGFLMFRAYELSGPASTKPAGTPRRITWREPFPGSTFEWTARLDR